MALDYSDPQVRAAELARRQAARAGKKYNIPPALAAVAEAYKNDPKTKLALTAMATGADTSPVAQGEYGLADGIARALTGVAGGYIAKRQNQKYGPLQDDTLDRTELQAQARMQAQAANPGGAMPINPAAVPPPAPQASPQVVETAGALGSPAPMASGAPGGLPGVPGGMASATGGGPMGRNPFPAPSPGSGVGSLSLLGGRNALQALGARVTSGYRTPAHNREVGGTRNSFHTRGTEANPLAYDFVPPKGVSMAELAADAKKAYPGFDVINEGDHVHVEPSDAMAARGTATRDTNGNAVPGPPAAPLAEGSLGDTSLPPPIAEPEAPKPVGPRRSELLQAAYDVMLDKDPFQYAQGQEMFTSGLSQQDKFNESAAEREQAILTDTFNKKYGLYADDVNARTGHKYRSAEERDKEAFDASESRLDRAARASESRLDRAARAEEARIKATEAVILKRAPAKVASGYSSNNAAIKQIDAAIEAIEKNPGHLGLMNMLGDDASQRRDPAGVPIRASVADIGSLKRHDRSGASVTVGEQPYLKPFIPSVNDTDKAAVAKLRKLRENLANENSGIEVDFGEEAGYVGFPSSSGAAAPTSTGATTSNW